MWFHMLPRLCEVMLCVKQLKQTLGSWEQAAVVLRVGNASSVRDSRHTPHFLSMSTLVSVSELRSFASGACVKEAVSGYASIFSCELLWSADVVLSPFDSKYNLSATRGGKFAETCGADELVTAVATEVRV